MFVFIRQCFVRCYFFCSVFFLGKTQKPRKKTKEKNKESTRNPQGQETHSRDKKMPKSNKTSTPVHQKSKASAKKTVHQKSKASAKKTVHQKSKAYAQKTQKSKASAKKIVRRPVRKSVPLRIVPPRHLSKDVWANRTVDQLKQAKEAQRQYCHDQTFNIVSTSVTGQEYQVVCDSNGSWTCECSDFVFRSSKNKSHYGFYCKHIAKCIDIVLDKKMAANLKI